MSGSLNLRRSTAATAALIVAGWGAFAAPAVAGPSHGNGNAASQGNANSASHANGANGANGAKDESAKGDKGNNGKGPKGNNGNGPKANNGNGPKGNNGKGPKGNNGNHGTAANGNADQGSQPGPAAGGAGAGGAEDPAGNNGTVKITPHLEDDGIPQNTPHVSCIFDIEWYGFDAGEDIWSTVEFAMQAPTTDVALSGTDPSQVFVGDDPASGAGTDSGFDGEATYSLVFDGEAHPQQGYHVKLTVHTPGSQGADTKHKVFWVKPCEDEAGVPEASAADEDTATEAPGEAEESSDESGAMGTSGTDDEVVTESDAAKAESNADTSEAAETASDSDAMGTSAGAAGSAEADVPNSVDAGGAGARITDLVTSPWSLLVMALGLALGGAALVARRRTV